MHVSQRQHWLSLELIKRQPSLHSNRSSLSMPDSLAATAIGKPTEVSFDLLQDYTTLLRAQALEQRLAIVRAELASGAVPDSQDQAALEPMQEA